MTGGGAGTSTAAKHDKQSAEMVTKHAYRDKEHTSDRILPQHQTSLRIHVLQTNYMCRTVMHLTMCASEHRTY